MAAAEEVTGFLGELCESLEDTEPEIAAELESLCLSLLEEAGNTLDRLFVHYHVDPVGLLEILRQNRLRWRFDNVWRMFQDRRLKELETWPGSLEQAADQLALAKPLLLHEWCDAIAALFSDGREIQIAEEDGQSAILVSTELPESARPDTAVGLSECLERVEVGRLAMLGDARINETSGHMEVGFYDQIDQAIAVLRKSAMTLRRRDLKAGRDAVTGKPIFGPGPRRKFSHEADCARELVDFFESETGRPLYDHVGRLLRATFPESCGRWSSRGEKRLRDRVKQLLTQR